ncbi:MAG TPA: TolC family protein [bacterium]|nr:TolC family protein [bacterium]
MRSRVLAAIAVLLGACASDPPPPIDDDLGIELPDEWATPPAEPIEGAVALDWWRMFGDRRLDALVELSLQNNRNLRGSAARFAAAAAAWRIAGAPLLPEVDVGLTRNRSRLLFIGFPFGSGGVPSSTFGTYGLSLNVRWELDVWGRLRSADRAALADQQAALEDLQAAQSSLAGQVCRTWFAAVEARLQLELANATAKAFAQTLSDVRDRFRHGVRPALDVHQAATNLANAEASAAQRRDQLQRILRQLDVLIGRYPNGEFAIADALPSDLAPVPAGLPGELLRRRPDLRAAERRVAAAGCRVSAAEAALYPRLSLTGSAGTQSTDLEDLVDTDFRVWSLGVNLLQPLFRSGALRAEVTRQQALRAQALAGYGDAVLNAFREVEELLQSEVELAARHEHLARASEHAAAARDLARERWQLGLADFLAVADGQRRAFQAEAARITAWRQRIDNRIDLLLALGGGYGDPTAQGQE